MERQSLLEDALKVLFFHTESLNTKEKSEAQKQRGRFLKITHYYHIYNFRICMHFIKSHSKVKFNIQKCRCATDNDARVKFVEQKLYK